MAKDIHPFKETSLAPSTSCESNNNTVQRQNMNSSNRTGLSLPLVNQMAIPIYTSHSREEVEAGGRILFHDFIHQRFEDENLSDEVLGVHDPPVGPFGDVGPQIIFRVASPAAASTPEGYNNENWIQIGCNIRELADKFAMSTERPLIKRQADQVDLHDINRDSFFQLLNEIFRNGINKHCIVALFFFCSDVLIRCVRQELREQGTRLFFWSMQFLVERVCKWVHDHGGWEKVFSNLYKVVFRVSAIAALGIVICCGIVWIKRNW